MMSTYLGDDADGLDGFEFLTMAEAGEVGHWAVLRTLNESAGEAEIARAGRVGAADPGAPLRDGQEVRPLPSPPRRIRTRNEGAAQAGALSGRSPLTAARILCSPLREIRDTCICEQPSSLPDVDLLHPRREPHDTPRLPLALGEVRASSRRSRPQRVVAAGPRRRADPPARSVRPRRRLVASPRTRPSTWPRGRPGLSSMLCLESPVCVAARLRAGRSANSSVSLASADSTFNGQLLQARGRRTFQTRSRKWRRSSPRMVGTA